MIKIFNTSAKFLAITTLLCAVISFASALEPEIVRPEAGKILIRHTGFTIQFNEITRLADWVCYELTLGELSGSASRRSSFSRDPSIKMASQADSSDYRNSGFDRGHLAPAADMKWSKAAMKESFYMSNIAPQAPGFNRGIWKDLEEQVRIWAEENRAVLVASGPVLTGNSGTTGPGRIPVPAFFFKVIADVTEPGIKGIGFLLPNTKTEAPLRSYAVPVDFIESMTGYDFFYQLDDETEKTVESSADTANWTWNGQR